MIMNIAIFGSVLSYSRVRGPGGEGGGQGGREGARGGGKNAPSMLTIVNL